LGQWNGANGGNFMKNTTPDPAEPIGEVTIVNDFLPPPEQLVPKKNTVRVTMEFTKDSIDFFKCEAKRHNASYQAMIRNLVDAYAREHQQQFTDKGSFSCAMSLTRCICLRQILF
jgi:hypothetical protein